MSLKTIFAPLVPLSGSSKVLAVGLSLGPCGFAPVAPGTIGSLVAVLILAFFSHLLGSKLLGELLFRPWFWGVAVGLTIILFFVGKMAIDRLLLALGPQDFAWIVFDEALGIWLTSLLTLAIIVGHHGMAALPQTTLAALKFWAVVFLTFRIFDILKPFPVGWIDQHWISGAGIMLDDLVAAVYAGGLGGICLLFWP